MTDLSVGIIGAGNISSTYLALAPSFAGFSIRAIADLDPKAAEVRAKASGIEPVSVQSLLDDSSIDIVVNLTVPAAHHDVSHAVLQAGKHVYSEKPLAASMEEARGLAAVSRQTRMRVGCAPDTFLGGSHQQARAMIDDGLIGTVVSGTAHVMSRGMEHWHPNPDFFFETGGGPVLDLGPYYITNLVNLLGPVERVTAVSRTAFKERTILSEPRSGQKIRVATPTTLHAILEFEQGAAITLGASWDVKAHRHGHMELYGTQGSLFVPDPNTFGGTVQYADNSGNLCAPEIWDHPFSVANHQRQGGDMQANYRGAGLADLAAAIDANRPHRCALDLSAHVLDVMMAILQSAEMSRPVDVSTSCDRPAPLSPAAAHALLRRS
ncbi:MAG: Gfo/Idh/MocA family oxidoreductase [Pseudomonadota bacterium]